jgi:hypothetical protein
MMTGKSQVLIAKERLLRRRRLVTAADFLIYSMATAELRMLDDGELDAVNNFKAVMSGNLRTLLN